MSGGLVLLRADRHRRMPWKNGGGVTTEIWAEPAGSTLQTFEWRLSMADVAADGPFSVFPGVDRTLALLDGVAIDLDIEGRGTVAVAAKTPPVSFPADVAVMGRLRAGPIRDLNVMTRRSKARHAVERISPEAGVALARIAPVELLVAHGGDVDLQVCGDQLRLASGDAVFAPTRSADPWRIAAASAAKFYRIAIWPSGLPIID